MNCLVNVFVYKKLGSKNFIIYSRLREMTMTPLSKACITSYRDSVVNMSLPCTASLIFNVE